jgi:hypothetical protein
MPARMSSEGLIGKVDRVRDIANEITGTVPNDLNADTEKNKRGKPYHDIGAPPTQQPLHTVGIGKADVDRQRDHEGR